MQQESVEWRIIGIGWGVGREPLPQTIGDGMHQQSAPLVGDQGEISKKSRRRPSIIYPRYFSVFGNVQVEITCSCRGYRHNGSLVVHPLCASRFTVVVRYKTKELLDSLQL